MWYSISSGAVAEWRRCWPAVTCPSINAPVLNALPRIVNSSSSNFEFSNDFRTFESDHAIDPQEVSAGTNPSTDNHSPVSSGVVNLLQLALRTSHTLIKRAPPNVDCVASTIFCDRPRYISEAIRTDSYLIAVPLG